jgi:hypothetical protein
MNLSSIGCGDGGWVGPIQASQLVRLIVKASEVRHLGSNTSKNMILQWCMISVIVDNGNGTLSSVKRWGEKALH